MATSRKAGRNRDGTEDAGDIVALGRRRGRGSTAVYEDLREDILSLRIASAKRC
jgi:hypothetical protein